MVFQVEAALVTTPECWAPNLWHKAAATPPEGILAVPGWLFPSAGSALGVLGCVGTAGPIVCC